MGRRIRAFVAALVVALATHGYAHALPPTPLGIGSRPCSRQGPLDSVRPASCRRMTFAYGPLHVTPGDNLILIGPV